MQLAGLDLVIEVDQVLRGQGADPTVLRKRRPALVQIAKQAILEGTPLLSPVVIYREFKVINVLHTQIELEGGWRLSGDLLTRQLAPAQEVILMVGTIGPAVEQLASQVFAENPSLGLALDGFGTAAVDALISAACCTFENRAKALDLQITLPYSPGMVGWELAMGQLQIFSALQPDPQIISLNASGLMLPRKSASLVLGVGSHFATQGSVCEYCVMQATCKYPSRHVP